MPRSSPLMLALAIVVTAAHAAAPPPWPSESQRARMKEAHSSASAAERYRLFGLYKSAIASAARALAIEREVFGTTHPAVAERLQQLAALQEGAGDWKSAVRSLEEAARIQAGM